MSEAPVHTLIADPVFRRAVDLMDAGDVNGLSAHLSAHSGLTRQRESFPDHSYFQKPSLLEFIAENPVRHDKLPTNAVAVARTILLASPQPDRESLDGTLTLVCSGRVVREAGVQVELTNLLCEHGADPEQAMAPALGHGEFAAVQVLLDNGATMTLPVAAAIGHVGAARDLLPNADADTRHHALALSAQHGHADITRIMLAAGEDPDRFNPPDCHAHSTPLHQAALAGHADVVRALLDHGARRDIPDKIHNAPAWGWAAHGGHASLAALIRGS